MRYFCSRYIHHALCSNKFIGMTTEQLTWIKQERAIYKNKALRPPPSTVDFYFSDIIVNTTLIADSDSAKQAETAIENLTEEIIAQEILPPQRHRDFEQDSNKGIEVLESAEYEWKSATKSGQQRTDDLFSSPINSILSLFSCLNKIRYW
ncbi:unnamed protein product [Rotaria magnacalcarata]|uniref:Uncharacterized protein n=2 Tax=Rotaria magnacalcarata TaxID=392030 RepID=A0A8S3F404_9BILA|nr:unnamed protein product [Rotaria magnacalcarata]